MGIKKLTFGFDEYPVYIRKGAIIPMNVTNAMNGHGSALSRDYTTVLMYPEKGEKKFGLYEEGKTGAMLSYDKDVNTLTLKATATGKSLLFKVSGEPTPVSVLSGTGTSLAQALSMAELVTLQSGYFIDGTTTWYAVKDVSAGTQIDITY